MALNSSQLRLGKRVRVAGFTAKVAEGGKYDDDGNVTTETYRDLGSQVRVTDDAGRNTHYISLTALAVPVPYADGALYLSNAGTFAFYVAGPDGKPGKWRLRLSNGEPGDTERNFDYPTRPLKLVSLGDALND